MPCGSTLRLLLTTAMTTMGTDPNCKWFKNLCRFDVNRPKTSALH
jgi:hypothetical protein